MRTQLLKLLKHSQNYELLEASISPFEIQKADELFITNVIQGIQPITSIEKRYLSNVSLNYYFKIKYENKIDLVVTWIFWCIGPNAIRRHQVLAFFLSKTFAYSFSIILFVTIFGYNPRISL